MPFATPSDTLPVDPGSANATQLGYLTMPGPRRLYQSLDKALDDDDLPSSFNRMRIYHPSDPDQRSFIANIPANDTFPRGTRYDVAYWWMYVATELHAIPGACGFFSLTPDGPAVRVRPDGFLKEPQYFFRIEKDYKGIASSILIFSNAVQKFGTMR
jgi:hypothetical protein